MHTRLRYRKIVIDLFTDIDPCFLAGVTAVPYLFFPESSQELLKVECFHNESWQYYGNYDLIRGYIFPFIDPASNRILLNMIYGRKSYILETIHESNCCLVVSNKITKRFVGLNDQFMKGLKYYQKHVDPTIVITLEE